MTFPQRQKPSFGAFVLDVQDRPLQSGYHDEFEFRKPRNSPSHITAICRGMPATAMHIAPPPAAARMPARRRMFRKHGVPDRSDRLAMMSVGGVLTPIAADSDSPSPSSLDARRSVADRASRGPAVLSLLYAGGGRARRRRHGIQVAAPSQPGRGLAPGNGARPREAACWHSN
jgi:hypothetical protein